MGRGISVALARALKTRIGHVLTTMANDMTEEIQEDLDKKVRKCINNFAKRELGIWNHLGEGTTEYNKRNNLWGQESTWKSRPNRSGWSRKVEVTKKDGTVATKMFNSNLHKFQNRTGEMKDYTGYVILYNNEVVYARNRLFGKNRYRGVNDEYALPLAKVTTGYGVTAKGSVVPSMRSGIKQTKKGATSNSYLSIAIFADSEHAFYVDNPLNNPRVNKNGDDYLPQGTGWFRMYAQQVAEIWMSCVIDELQLYINEFGTTKLRELGLSQSDFGRATMTQKTLEEKENYANDRLTFRRVKQKTEGQRRTYKAREIHSSPPEYSKTSKRSVVTTLIEIKLTKGGRELKIPAIITGSK